MKLPKKFIKFITADGCEKYSALIAHEKHNDIFVPLFNDGTLSHYYGVLNEEMPPKTPFSKTRRYKSTFQETTDNDGTLYVIYREFVE